MDPSSAAGGDNTISSSSAVVRTAETSSSTKKSFSSARCSQRCDCCPYLDKSVGELDVPSMDNNASVRDFVSKLVKNGSDKGFMHQKKYQKLMEPIIEEQELPILGQQGEEDDSIDMVDYDGNDTEEVNQAGRVRGYIQGAILALATPSLEHERMDVVIPVHGSQLEVENMHEDM
jgi:hypothetical protein